MTPHDDLAKGEPGLRDPNPEIRLELIRRIRERGDAPARRLLLELVQDEDWRVRKAAVDAIVAAPDEALIAGLIETLSIEDNAGARNSAIEALTRLGSEATGALSEGFRRGGTDERKFIIDILGEIRDPASLTLMLEALGDEDDNVKASAIEHLGKMGESSVVDHLIDILQSGEFWMAYPAADALGLIGDARAVPALIEALEKKALREPVVRALGRIGTPAALPHVARLFAEGAKVVQEESLRALMRIILNGDEQVSDTLRRIWGENAPRLLLPFTRDDKVDLKKAALLVLGVLKDVSTIAPLLELVGDEELGGEVIRVLTRIVRSAPEEFLPFFDDDLPLHRRTVVRVAAESRDELFRVPLRKVLRDDDGHVRATAAVGLAMFNDVTSVDEIRNLLVDPYEDVQEAAVQALVMFGDAIPRELVFEGIVSPDARLRRNYARLMGYRKMDDEQSLEALGFALKDGEPSVRTAVVAALTTIGGEDAKKILIRALTDEIPDIRRAAALALGDIGGGELVASVALLAEDPDDWVRAAAATALGNLGGVDGQETLIRFLDDESGLVRTTAAESLGRVDGGAACDALTARLDDPDPEMRRTVVEALGEMGAASAAGRIRGLLDDVNWAVRKAAAETFMRLDPESARDVLMERLNEESDDTVIETLRRILGV